MLRFEKTVHDSDISNTETLSRILRKSVQGGCGVARRNDSRLCLRAVSVVGWFTHVLDFWKYTIAFHYSSSPCEFWKLIGNIKWKESFLIKIPTLISNLYKEKFPQILYFYLNALMTIFMYILFNVYSTCHIKMKEINYWYDVNIFCQELTKRFLSVTFNLGQYILL